MIVERGKEKHVLLSNLRRAVTLVTESLKVSPRNIQNVTDRLLQIKTEEKKAVIPEQPGNLFEELHQILTSTEAIDLDDDEASSMVDVQQSGLNFR